MMVAIVGCEENETVVPSPIAPSPTPTLISPEALPTLAFDPVSGFTASDCLVEQQILPNLCGIVLGQMTTGEVQERLGEPITSGTGAAYVLAPSRSRIDMIWGYDGVGAYFDDETVIILAVGLCSYELTLGEAVEALGPPDRVILFHEVGSSPPEWEQARRANSAIFLWPDKGVYLHTALYGTQGVGLDEDEEVPLFPAGMPINIMEAFEPCTLDELEAIFQELYPPGPWTRWIDWPGVTE